ncbi:MAG TPA: cobalt transporter CbiM [Bryobacteraceae bacterium]|nr:cobalt transporter CbiM [Bryobacteraceae bacterium]
MHIPDGYLSPTTCAALYGGAAPFWYVALRRIRKALHTRLVPRLSLFSAFCFVIMMFNLPLPGGTTGHAVGVGLAPVVLGPWGAMLSLSIALVIQALFFGDGGITAIGANCFNMAIVGSLVSYGVYRAIAGRSPLVSGRRVVAAGIAGYVAINAAAFCAAIEFGIQPMLYRDAAGAPLYCPYPLSIAVPAMMIGHLTVAGLAELFVSAGVVGFLQRSDLSLLRDASGVPASVTDEEPATAGKVMRPLWVALGALMILTPLGILAGGAAWGEWLASEYADPAARQQIAASSLHQAPPGLPPKGLERLSSVWTAPFAQYAPPYVRSRAFGYLLSAMFGVGLVLLGSLAAGRFLRGRAREEAAGS